MTYSYKYLGVTLTSSLNKTDHLSATIKKASSRIHPLKKMRSHMDYKTSKLIFQSMIIPILTYCPLSLYGSIPPYMKNRINAMEARAQLIIDNENEVAKSEIINKKRLCLFVHKFYIPTSVMTILVTILRLKTLTLAHETMVRNSLCQGLNLKLLVNQLFIKELCYLTLYLKKLELMMTSKILKAL